MFFSALGRPTLFPLPGIVAQAIFGEFGDEVVLGSLSEKQLLLLLLSSLSLLLLSLLLSLLLLLLLLLKCLYI